MLPLSPDRIVTEIAPQALMGETFGPALAFWHGCALTAWFVCEGPFSRTDIPGLSAYHARHLSALRDLATPVDGHLFEELNEAEAHLGPAAPIERSVSSTDLGYGVSVSMRVGMGSRRSGFEKLRNIITRYRRDWGRRYLPSYLRARWEEDLGEPARHYAQTIADRGKPPAPKQFARQAAAATNRWFGGDISAFYAAIGEKSTYEPRRASLMPADRRGLPEGLRRPWWSTGHKKNCGPEPRGRAGASCSNPTEQRSGTARRTEPSFYTTRGSPGHPPAMKEFRGFAERSAVLAPDVDRAWQIYAAAIRSAMDRSDQEAPDARPFAQEHAQIYQPRSSRGRRRDAGEAILDRPTAAPINKERREPIIARSAPCW